MTQRRIYQTEFPYFISTNAHERKQFFADTYFAAELYHTILKVRSNLQCIIYVFSIMPDHLHLLLQPNEKVNISEVLQQTKSIFAKSLREKFNLNQPIWQRRFNSRIIDNEERLRNTINYVLTNSVKAKLPKKYQKKPYLYYNKKAVESLFGIFR